mgnify:CR=1 FL=1
MLRTHFKLDLAISLLKEVSKEIDTKAEQIKDKDHALYRMLTEEDSYSIKEIIKKMERNGYPDLIKTRLEVAESYLNS